MPAPVPAVAPEAKFLPEGLIYLRQGILPPGPRKVPRRASRLGKTYAPEPPRLLENEGEQIILTGQGRDEYSEDVHLLTIHF